MRDPTDDFTPIEQRCVGTARVLLLFQLGMARIFCRDILYMSLEDAALILEQGWAPQFFNKPGPGTEY
jgi:hypothetical protein